mmetsp:Transcript_14890/g.38152  ORF Transcript_14890/g.38152 Transcript_14890/m.38152 type:complete len:448 (+) Transcript_14890:66-1409(+)
MISALYVYNYKGELVISRAYRDDIDPKACCDTFRANVIHSRTGEKPPINTIANKSYIHIYRFQVWFVAVTADNSNAAMVLAFMEKFMSTCGNFFGEFTEINVKNNFALIYELLDEVLDFGYPQTTDADALKILSEDSRAGKGDAAMDAKSISSQVTGQIGWRRQDIKYRTNELWLDVYEKVSCVISTSGQTLSSHCTGVIKMKCQLSGMPDCKFGINDALSSAAKKKTDPKKDSKKKDPKKKEKLKARDAIAIDDLTFHQCVKLGKFDKDRTISFIPPDGEFDLMNYRTTHNIVLPFKITPIVKELPDRIDFTIVVRSEYKAKESSPKVKINIPTPTNGSKVHIPSSGTSTGKAKYESTNNQVVWKIKNFGGQKNAQCQFHVDLLKTAKKKKWVRPPIRMTFEVPFAPSGLNVWYLQVRENKLGYNDSDIRKWVRYIGSAGDYEARL